MEPGPPRKRMKSLISSLDDFEGDTAAKKATVLKEEKAPDPLGDFESDDAVKLATALAATVNSLLEKAEAKIDPSGDGEGDNAVRKATASATGVHSDEKESQEVLEILHGKPVKKYETRNFSEPEVIVPGMECRWSSDSQL